MIKRNKNKEICWGKTTTTTTTTSNKKNPGYIMIFMHKYMFLVFFFLILNMTFVVSLCLIQETFTHTHHTFAASLNRKRDNRHHQVKRLSRMKINQPVILTWRSSEDDNQNHKTKKIGNLHFTGFSKRNDKKKHL